MTRCTFPSESDFTLTTVPISVAVGSTTSGDPSWRRLSRVTGTVAVCAMAAIEKSAARLERTNALAIARIAGPPSYIVPPILTPPPPPSSIFSGARRPPSPIHFHHPLVGWSKRRSAAETLLVGDRVRD